MRRALRRNEAPSTTPALGILLRRINHPRDAREAAFSVDIIKCARLLLEYRRY